MIGFVEAFLQGASELPYRLLQCCTGDLGVKNADMIDLECWMPGRGEPDADGVPRASSARRTRRAGSTTTSAGV
jgi:seryl-tRNA synthetase